MTVLVDLREKNEKPKEILMSQSSIFDSDAINYESELNENSTIYSNSYASELNVQKKKISFDDFYLLKLIGKGKIALILIDLNYIRISYFFFLFVIKEALEK
jgi:hypothetical protein